MDATKLRDIVTSAIGREQLEEFARELGAVKRQSKVHMMELLTALILAARTNVRRSRTTRWVTCGTTWV